MDEKEIMEICKEVDSLLADYLADSIINKTSYDVLEARHGIVPSSRRNFYRRRGKVLQIMQSRKEN